MAEANLTLFLLVFSGATSECAQMPRPYGLLFAPHNRLLQGRAAEKQREGNDAAQAYNHATPSGV
jgi:hypothetical protein